VQYLGQQLSSLGSELSWTGIGAVGVSGIAALLAPEGAPAEVAGAVEGASLIEAGGYISGVGATLQGYAHAGLPGAVEAAVPRFAGEAALPFFVSRLFTGVNEAFQSAFSSLVSKIPEAVATEQVACGVQ
jgi:hypothetical protein